MVVFSSSYIHVTGREQETKAISSPACIILLYYFFPFQLRALQMSYTSRQVAMTSYIVLFMYIMYVSLSATCFADVPHEFSGRYDWLYCIVLCMSAFHLSVLQMFHTRLRAESSGRYDWPYCIVLCMFFF